MPGRRQDVGGRWGYSPAWQGLAGEALNRHHGAPKIALKGARHERGTGELVHGGVRSEEGSHWLAASTCGGASVRSRALHKGVKTCEEEGEKEAELTAVLGKVEAWMDTVGTSMETTNHR